MNSPSKLFNEKMFEMKLGERVVDNPSNNTSEQLTRVPGGWVYSYGDLQGCSSVFIPFEFMPCLDPDPKPIF